MKLYVGLDVGLEETSLCIVDSEGVTVREVSPVYEPDEEHATALVLNAKERMDPAWRMQVATVLMANAARNRSSEIRSAACLEKSQKSVAGS